jgi:bisphosphoglycerate-independent phosphoglycerate mutase (AlkP superfamily)
VATYDLNQKWRRIDLKKYGFTWTRKGKLELIRLNFANPDMVGHTEILMPW